MSRKILHPTADPVFKRIFGQEKAIAIEVINLLIKPPNPVVELEYLPQEMFPDLNDGKISIVDVRYAAKAYGQQLKKGMSYKDAQSIYLLSFVHHAIKPDSSQWLHNISMMDKSDPTFEIPGINLVFLELAKRKKMGNFNFDYPISSRVSSPFK